MYVAIGTAHAGSPTQCYTFTSSSQLVNVCVVRYACSMLSSLFVGASLVMIHVCTHSYHVIYMQFIKSDLLDYVTKTGSCAHALRDLVSNPIQSQSSAHSNFLPSKGLPQLLDMHCRLGSHGREIFTMLLVLLPASPFHYSLNPWAGLVLLPHRLFQPSVFI